MAVKLPGGLTPFSESLAGLRQECNVSPMLFNIYVSDLIEELQNDDCDPVIINNCSFSCFMYVDDLLVLSESWEGLTASLNKLDTFSNKWKLTISEKRPKFWFFVRMEGNIVIKFLKHKVGNIIIKICNEYTYLGTTFTQSNSFKVARKQLQKKATEAMFTCLRHINTCEGAKPKTIIKLFYSLIKPILIYNSEVRGAFLKPNKIRDLVQFSTYSMFDESHLQNKLCRYILDVHKKFSSLAVKGELGVYPISINIYINIMKFLNVTRTFIQQIQVSTKTG